MGKYWTAMEFLLKAKYIFQKILGNGHKKTIWVSNELECVARKYGNEMASIWETKPSGS